MDDSKECSPTVNTETTGSVSGASVTVEQIHAATVVLGDYANVSTQNPPVQNTSSSPTSPITPTRTEPLRTSAESLLQDDSCAVLEKCDQFIRQDYLNMYGTITEYPWQTKKKPFKNAFMAITLTSDATDNNACEQQHEDIMYKIFDGWEGCEKPTRVLLYGSPGIGKTTLCQKYVFDWANKDMATQRPPFNQFKVVIFLKLHDVKGTLEEIVQAQVFCTSLTPDERQQFFTCMRKHPEWFLFILDGVNECKVDKLEDVKRFLEHGSYRGVYLIATSRPELRKSWMNLYHDFHAHFCVRGYSKQSVLEFVASHLNDNPTKAGELKEHIEATSNLMDLARIPLLTPIICEHWKECDRLPAVPTMTKLLNYCLDVVVKLFCHKMNIDWNRDAGLLPPPIQEQLEHLEKLALHGVMKGSMNYSDAELKEYHIDSTYDLGFLSAQPETCSPLKEGVHCFAHKSIQEFVAAKWLVKNLNSNEVSRMLTDVDITKFHSVLVFIAGLLSNEQSDRLLNFIKQLSASKVHACSFLEKGYYGYRMQLILESCYEAWQTESRDGESSIAQGILSLTKTKELFQKVITPGELPLMGFTEARGLSLLVCRSTLTSLNLSGIWIQATVAGILATECLRGNRSLTSVKFSNCRLCPDGVEAICRALETMPQLEEVDLSCSNLSDKGLRAVAGLLCNHNGAIKILHLDDYFDAKQVQQEKQGISQCRQHIKELCAFYDQCEQRSHEEGSILDFIAAVNDEACELQEISLHHCQIGKHMEKWLTAFHSREDLRKVRLCLKHLDDDLCEELVTFVNNKPQFQEMSIILRDEDLLAADMDKHLAYLKNSTNDRIQLTCRNHHQSIRSLHSILSFRRN